MSRLCNWYVVCARKDMSCKSIYMLEVTLLGVSCYLMMVLVGTRVVMCQVDFEYVCLLSYRVNYFTSMKKAKLDKIFVEKCAHIVSH